MGYLSERTHWSWNLKSETMPARQTVFLAYVMPWEGSWGASWRSCKETRWFSSKQGRGENGGDKTEAGNPESGPQKCWYGFGSVQYSSVAQSCPTLCDPMNCSMPGLPVNHQFLEFTQTHIYWVGDAIYPSHPLSSPSPPAPNPSQHQSLFQWVNSLHEVAKVLEFQL